MEYTTNKQTSVFTNIYGSFGFYLRAIASPVNSARFRAIQKQLSAIPHNGVPIGNSANRASKFVQCDISKIYKIKEK